MLQKERCDYIAKSLILAVDSVQRDWRSVVHVQTGTVHALRRLAEDPDINTTEFFSPHHEFRETLFLYILSDDLRASIADLLRRRKESQTNKEECVRMRDYEEAAICLVTEQEITAQIIDRLAGKTITITAECVRTAIGKMGWVENNT